MKKGKGNSGVTLIELMMVIGIFAVLAAVAVPNFVIWLPNYRLKQAARDLLSNFQLARLTAIKMNTCCSITFNQPIDNTTYSYVIYVDGDNDLEYDQEGEVIICKILWENYKSVDYDTTEGKGDGLTFHENDDGLPSIAFQPNGLTRNNTGGFGAGTAYLINTRNKKVRIVVSCAGNIRIEEP